ncbi:MAG: hypothetical protein EXQ91_06375 [Alphaproteobacteria bacterium]|nr:hypothetical protein [Alphaproteobacteria bacterium]
MSGLAARFFGSAIVYSTIGLLLGIHMAICENHAQMPTHAHTMLIGWVSFAIFGFFYHAFPARG